MTEQQTPEEEMREFARALFADNDDDNRARGIFAKPTTKESNS